MRVFRLDLRFNESIAVRVGRDEWFDQVAAKYKQMRPWVSGSAGGSGAVPETQNEKTNTC
jgi:hypothetical protein